MVGTRRNPSVRTVADVDDVVGPNVTPEETKEESETASKDETEKEEEETDLKSVLESLNQTRDGKPVSYASFTSALKSYNEVRMTFPLTINQLMALKDKYCGVSKRRSKSGKVAKNSKSWYCKKLDAYMREKNASEAVEVAVVEEGRWSKRRDGFRFITAVFESRRYLADAFKSKTREVLDDDTAVSDKETFFNAVTDVFNNDSMELSMPWPVHEVCTDDDINKRVILDAAGDMKRKIEITFTQCVEKFKMFEDVFIRISGKIDKSGHHEQNPRKYFKDDVDMAYFYMKMALPEPVRKLGQGALKVSIDGTSPGRLKSSRGNRKRKTKSDVMLSMFQTLVSRIGDDEKKAKKPKKTKSTVVKELVDVKKMILAIDNEDDPVRAVLEQEVTRLCNIYASLSDADDEAAS
eukprot:g149.t1